MGRLGNTKILDNVSNETFANYVKTSANWVQLSKKCGYKNKSVAVQKRAKKLGLDCSHFGKVTGYLTDKDLEEIVATSISVQEVAKKCGYKNNQGVINHTLRKRLRELNFDTGHFRKKPKFLGYNERINDNEFEKIFLNSTNWKQVCSRTGMSNSGARSRAKKLGLETSHFKKGKINSIPDETFRNAVNESKTWGELAVRLGFSTNEPAKKRAKDMNIGQHLSDRPKSKAESISVEEFKTMVASVDNLSQLHHKLGGARELLEQRIGKLGLDISHFCSKRQPIKPEDFFVQNSTASERRIFQMLGREKTDADKRRGFICENDASCLEKEGKIPIHFRIKHKNGDISDNRRDNIKVLCVKCMPESEYPSRVQDDEKILRKGSKAKPSAVKRALFNKGRGNFCERCYGSEFGWSEDDFSPRTLSLLYKNGNRFDKTEDNLELVCKKCIKSFGLTLCDEQRFEFFNQELLPLVYRYRSQKHCCDGCSAIDGRYDLDKKASFCLYPKDGDYQNKFFRNLELLCPKCIKSKNKKFVLKRRVLIK
jgi:hypothetical protein